MEHLRCVVERITYQNADNGYTVLKCAVKNYCDLVTVVGSNAGYPCWLCVVSGRDVEDGCQIWAAVFRREI